MGLLMCLQPIYFTEISPDEHRGFLNTIINLLAEFGFVFGSLVALPEFLGTDKCWPFLFWLEIVPNLLAFLVLPFLPESPKFLMSRDSSKDRVVRSLEFFQHKNIEVKNFID